MLRLAAGTPLGVQVNHGIPDEVVGAFDEQMRSFFALPREEKGKVKRSIDNSRYAVVTVPCCHGWCVHRWARACARALFQVLGWHLCHPTRTSYARSTLSMLCVDRTG